MAKKAKGGKPAAKAKKPKGAEPTQPVKPSEAIQCTPLKDFEALARRCSSLQSQVSENSGTMGELIKDAAEKKHLHKGAFALWRKLDKMGKGDPGKLAAFLAHFDYYRDLKVKDKTLDDVAAEQDQMFARTEAGEGDEAEAGEDPGTPAGETDQRPRFKTHEGGKAQPAQPAEAAAG